MRIGMMTDVYKPHISGVTNYIALNKKAYEKAGHEVYVFTFSDDKYVDDEPNIIRSPGLPLSYRYGDKDYKVGIRYTKKVRKLFQAMDIIHVHHPFISGTLALRYSRPKNIPVVFTSHTRFDIYMKVFAPQIPTPLGMAFLETYLPNYCRSCDLVIAPSHSLKDFLRQIKVDSEVEVIPNGIDLSPFKGIDPVLKREAFGFGEDDVVLIYVGRLSKEKNLSFLLQSFSAVAQAFENVRMLVVGDGPDREELQIEARGMGLGSQVYFTGLVPYAETPHYFHIADVFVTSSISEVHPLSVIEAMASGLPVMGIGEGGVGDTVKDGITGYLAPNEIASYTAKLSRLVVDQDTRRAMRSKSVEAAENYSIDRTSATVFSHYQRLVETSRTNRRGIWSRLTTKVAGLRG